MLAPLGFEVIAQAELGITEADEPHDTFLENALAKARHASRATGLPALADDSGLCVEALGGEPGVHSAYFAGREGAREERDARNNAKLVELLRAQRTARRTTTACWCWCAARRSQPLVAEGRWHGEIVRSRAAPADSATTRTSSRAARAHRRRARARGEEPREPPRRRRSPRSAARLKRSADMARLAELPPLSLYVHMPWCLKKCPYCDFNSHEKRGELPEAEYVDALIADLEASVPNVWGGSCTRSSSAAARRASSRPRPSIACSPPCARACRSIPMPRSRWRPTRAPSRRRASAAIATRA